MTEGVSPGLSHNGQDGGCVGSTGLCLETRFPLAHSAIVGCGETRGLAVEDFDLDLLLGACSGAVGGKGRSK